MSRGRAGLAVLLCAAAVGCTSGGSAGPPTTTAPTTASPGPAVSAADRLAGLAGAAAQVRYRATYAARQAHPRSRATWRVWRTPTALRVDVITRQARATLIVSPRGSFSCRAARHRKTCFLVAKAGKPVPAPFQLLAQQLFSTNAAMLREHADDYRVLTRPATEGSPTVPAASCFAVRPRPDAPRPRVARGSYCYADTGVLVSVAFPSGSTVRLLHVHVAVPPHRVFSPYSSPTPIPGAR